MVSPLLQVEDLAIEFETRGRPVRVVDGVGFVLEPGKSLGIVGESGCGKSVTALSLVGLLPQSSAQIVSGRAVFMGRDLLELGEAELQKVRGGQIGFVFQEPMTSLNPVFTIGDQVAEAVRAHRRLGLTAARAEAIELLARVRIAAPEQRMRDYPHQMSGGMRQRVMIAMALAGQPKLLIADEPTTALDVTIQLQIIDLLDELRRDLGMALIIITHDLGVIGETADEVAVMYMGSIVERTRVARLFEDPQHPYTIGLLASMPVMSSGKGPLTAIEGSVPPPGLELSGCRFAARCPLADRRCRETRPPLAAIAEDHAVACWKAPLERLAA
ncbi:MAG: ABC transporter ATP-binding protein [Telmatospirillum sp.]|nr:ABC transporter ATP-binding protein [Telmatospirillum sp.]